MKRKYTIFFTLILPLLFVLAGEFFIFEKLRTENISLVNQPSKWDTNTWLKKSTWVTYVNKEFGFSIEYPEKLTPEYLPSEGRVIFFVGTLLNHLTSVIDITIGTVPTNVKDRFPPEKLDRITFYDGVARSIKYHGSRAYFINIQGVDAQSAERIINSIKFFE